jgi:hypothetical protein
MHKKFLAFLLIGTALALTFTLESTRFAKGMHRCISIEDASFVGFFLILRLTRNGSSSKCAR